MGFSFLLPVHLHHVPLFRNPVLIPCVHHGNFLLHMNILYSFLHPEAVLMCGHFFHGEIFVKLSPVLLGSILHIVWEKKNQRAVKIGRADRNIAEIYRALEDFWKWSCELPITNNEGSKKSSFRKSFFFQKLSLLINFFI